MKFQPIDFPNASLTILKRPLNGFPHLAATLSGDATKLKEKAVQQFSRLLKDLF